MKFQSPIHLSVAAILVLTLLGAGVIVAQSGTQKTPRVAAPASVPTPSDGFVEGAAVTPADVGGCCGAVHEEAAPVMTADAPGTWIAQPAILDAGCCSGQTRPIAAPARGAAVAVGGLIPAMLEASDAAACCGGSGGAAPAVSSPAVGAGCGEVKAAVPLGGDCCGTPAVAPTVDGSPDVIAASP